MGVKQISNTGCHAAELIVWYDSVEVYEKRSLAVQLDDIVPWGRTFDEYRRMFLLDETELSGTILGCGDGPASFNAEASAVGYRVTSCDPIYQFSRAQLACRIAEVYEQVMEQLYQHLADYRWDEFRTPVEVGERRMCAMRAFLQDYPLGKAAGRYVEGELPTLPFPNTHFDLALCSHLLFLYSDKLSLAFHRLAIQELCRIATEVRIFPLLNLDNAPSIYLPTLIAELRAQGYQVTIESSTYEFQRGANQFLRIQHASL